MRFDQPFEDSSFKCIYQENYHGNLTTDLFRLYFIITLRKRLFYLFAS